MKWSLNGLKLCFKNESSFRLECLFLMFTIALCFILEFDLLKSFGLIICVLFIMIVELLNSAIEKICDLISKEQNVLIGYAKDAGSAAVMLGFLIYGILFFVFISKF